MYKKIFVILINLVLILFFFLVVDFFVSKHTNLLYIKKDCFEYSEIKHKNKKYYSYELEKNCFAYEHKGTTPSYTVRTDGDGHRIGKKAKPNNKNQIFFLGDSFTYGFGVDYEDSIPGQIDKKTNNKFKIVNFAVPGYSPSMNLYQLKKYLKKNKDIELKKVFYVLDLTDVHDESNRWSHIKGIDKPVIINEEIKKEIEKNFDLKKKFRVLRLLSYSINKQVRNLRKKIKTKFLNNQENIIDKKGTYWGGFTHTPYEILKKDESYKDFWSTDINVGYKNIMSKLEEISKLIAPYNSEFYIVIHPWKETLELGQNEFNWENFAVEICLVTSCNKVINFFDDVRSLKKINSSWYLNIYFKKDLHFNKKGNKIYSNHIFAEAFD